jgi:hypothetical protein
MIRSPDLSRNGGRYSVIAVMVREVALGFTPRSGARAPSAAGELVPEFARGHAGAYAKGSRQIGLGRELQRDCDIEEGGFQSAKQSSTVVIIGTSRGVGAALVKGFRGH